MKKGIDASKLVREMARERIGTVPTTRCVPDKKDKASKHKKRDLERAQED
jgi:hypothetical protein